MMRSADQQPTLLASVNDGLPSFKFLSLSSSTKEVTSVSNLAASTSTARPPSRPRTCSRPMRDGQSKSPPPATKLFFPALHLSPAFAVTDKPGRRTSRMDKLIRAESAALQMFPRNDVLLRALLRGVKGNADASVIDGFVDRFASSLKKVHSSKGMAVFPLSTEVCRLTSDSRARELLVYVLEEITQVSSVSRQGVTSKPKAKNLGSRFDNESSSLSMRYWTYNFAPHSATYYAILRHARDFDVIGTSARKNCTGFIIAEIGKGVSFSVLRAEVLRNFEGIEDTLDRGLTFFYGLAEKVFLDGGVYRPRARPIDVGSGSTRSRHATKTSVPLKPFRFLDLPPELRILVYRYVFAPGHISVRLNRQHFGLSHMVPDGLTPAIFRTCKLVHNEAQDMLYKENAICLTVDLTCGSLSIFAKQHHLDPVLSRLVRVTLVLNNPSVVKNGTGGDVVKYVDWRPLQAMVSLKEVRLCLLEPVTPKSFQKMLRRFQLVQQVIERLPGECKITYGMGSGPDQDHVRHVLEELANRKIHPHVVEGKLLQESAAASLPRQGCKSGHLRDYRYEAA